MSDEWVDEALAKRRNPEWLGLTPAERVEKLWELMCAMPPRPFPPLVASEFDRAAMSIPWDSFREMLDAFEVLRRRTLPRLAS